jgi:hypothetical protein
VSGGGVGAGRGEIGEKDGRERERRWRGEKDWSGINS